MATKKYDGPLGKFEYDDSKYTIVPDKDGEYCHYIGAETKGVIPPKGLKNYTGLYMGTNIEEPVVIEDGVTSVNSMYAECKSLIKGSKIPDSVIDQGFQYDGCTSLVEIPNFSKNAVNLSAAVANCPNLETLPPIPGSAKHCDSIALNDEKLSGPVEIGYGVEDIDCGFAGCKALDTTSIKFPTSIVTKEDVFENCDDFDFDEDDEFEDVAYTVESMEGNVDSFVDRYKAEDESNIDLQTVATMTKKNLLTPEMKSAMAGNLVSEASSIGFEQSK